MRLALSSEILENTILTLDFSGAFTDPYNVFRVLGLSFFFHTLGWGGGSSRIRKMPTLSLNQIREGIESSCLGRKSSGEEGKGEGRREGKQEDGKGMGGGKGGKGRGRQGNGRRREMVGKAWGSREVKGNLVEKWGF